jgi:hypothetical protein
MNTPNAVSVNVGKEVVEFKVGDLCENHFGKYRVADLRTDGNLVAEYTEVKVPLVFVGCRHVYPIKSQAEAIVSEQRRANLPLKKLDIHSFSDKEWMTVGWLFAGATLRVETSSSRTASFAQQYKLMTGTQPEIPNGENQVFWNESDKYWGLALGLSFQKPKDEDLGKFSMPNLTRCANGSLSIWKNSYNLGLIKLGMRIGKNGSQADDVLKKLSGSKAEYFKAGLDAARSELKKAV